MSEISALNVGRKHDIKTGILHSMNDMQQKLEDQKHALSALRHDLRGLLSPAMLAADQMSMHSDPHVRSCAERILESLDRAVALLKQSSQG